MEDVTDVVFREIIAITARPDVFFTEFTSIDALNSRGAERVKKKLHFTPMQRPIVAQIWGTKPENFKTSAALIQEMGFDGIDINMGCPDKNVVKCGSGAALINNTELVKEIVGAVREGAPNIPLSIKTRIATDHSLSDNWFNFLLEMQIDALTIHGRDAPSLSKVPTNWDEIGFAVKLKNEMKGETIIIGNGGIRKNEEISEKHKLYGVDGVMVGTGIFSNPWIFDGSRKIEEVSVNERTALLLKHTHLFEETWGKSKNFEILKKFFKIYIKEFKGADELRQELMATRKYEQVYQVIANYSTRI
jgi:tRNA-dihydrouridine synthase